jgi:hypothetical protein
LVQLIAVLSGIVGPVADEASDEEASDEASDEDDDITEVASNDAKKGSDEAEEDDEAFKIDWLNLLKTNNQIDAHFGDRLDDDGGAAHYAGVRFVHIQDNEWPSFGSVFQTS